MIAQTHTQTQNNPALDADKVMDVRPIPCSIKHGLILRTWYELPAGDYFILLNDHDPVPLRYQFQAEFGDAFLWEYLERGPENFRVKISKVHELPTGAGDTLGDSCPGH